MRIKMLHTTTGSHDGIRIHTYEKGEEFEVGGGHMPDDLAKAFLESGAAEELGKDKKAPPGPSETKTDTGKDDKKK